MLITHPQKEKPQNLKDYPFFSTIVPAWNEEKSIIPTLKSLISLDYPKDKMEIVVVNDGSTDKTAIFVKEFIEDNKDFNIKLINQKNKGKGSALNTGLKHIKGKYFACLDADSFISSNALQVMLPYFEEDSQVVAVCPLMKIQKPNSIIEKVQWYEYVINMFYRDLNSKLDCIHVTPGPFSVYRTNVVNKLGGFDEKTITEDLEMAIRLQNHHYKILQTFDTIVETIPPKTWRSLFYQRTRWYKGSVDNTIRYRHLLFNRKYGDFGFLRMPTIILSGVLAIFLVFVIIRELLNITISLFSKYSAIDFNLIPLITQTNFQIDILDLNFAKLFITLTIAAVSFGIMLYSHKIINEKITRHGKTFFSLITYLFIYSIFLTFVWIYILYLYVRGKVGKWR
ncbi:MAG: glycosyltransferase [archaeon]